MKFGVPLPSTHSYRPSQSPWEPTATMADRVRIAQQADALGYDWLSFADHIVIPNEWVPVYGEAWMEPLASMAYLAAVTRRIRLTTFVLVLPYRDPILTAKMVATLDVLSEGRINL